MSTALRQHRVARGLRQADLAELMGVDQSTISHWEHGTATPRSAALERLRAIFGTSAATLLEPKNENGDEPMPAAAAPTTAKSQEAISHDRE